MNQAQMIQDIIGDRLVVQSGVIYVLCDDGSQLAIQSVEGDRTTQYADQVLVRVIEPRKD